MNYRFGFPAGVGALPVQGLDVAILLRCVKNQGPDMKKAALGPPSIGGVVLA
jgi:hypothetical protein